MEKYSPAPASEYHECPCLPLPRRLLAGRYQRARGRAFGRQLRGRPHGRFDARKILDAPPGQALADAFDLEGHHIHSRRKLMSVAGAECVMAPDETKSAPLSA